MMPGLDSMEMSSELQMNASGFEMAEESSNSNGLKIHQCWHWAKIGSELHQLIIDSGTDMCHQAMHRGLYGA